MIHGALHSRVPIGLRHRFDRARDWLAERSQRVWFVGEPRELHVGISQVSVLDPTRSSLVRTNSTGTNPEPRSDRIVPPRLTTKRRQCFRIRVKAGEVRRRDRVRLEPIGVRQFARLGVDAKMTQQAERYD